MSINLLDYFLATQLATVALIFLRVGAAMMVLPGFGEMYVPPRVRILFALVFAVLLSPMLQPRMPITLPGSMIAQTMLILAEISIGVFMGLIARAVLMSLHVAGNIIAAQSSLAVASIFDPSSGQQSPVVSNLLSICAITLFFTMDLHHLVLMALVQSYEVFAVGAFPSMQDMNILHLRLVADAFALGVGLSSPFIIFSLLFYLAGGLMTRLMPNFQVFFIMMSPQIMIAFFLLMALMPMILNVFAQFMEQQYMNFIGG